MNPHADLRGRLVGVDEALDRISSGARIFLGSGCAEPQSLVHGLCRRTDRLHDLRVCSLLTLGTADYVNERFLGHFRHNAFLLGSPGRAAAQDGRADHTPVFPSEIPELFRSGQQPVDVALIQVAPPNAHGQLNFGIHVDIQRAAVEAADLVIAEVNPNMPRTHGNSSIAAADIDLFVETGSAILELPEPEPDEAELEIGMHTARLVTDGACLRLGIGPIAHAIARFLDDRRDLGLHAEVLSDAVLPLLENGNVTNRRKEVVRGRTVASSVMGTRRLYDHVDGNAAVELHPSDLVGDPRVICRNPGTVAVSPARQIDLGGQVCADSRGDPRACPIGGPADFSRGAAMSRGGRPVVALRSTAADGSSQIVARLDEGAGVSLGRGDVHWVVTEYGSAYLHGKSIRERALALAEIAHPDFRAELRDVVRERHYATVAPENVGRIFDAYPADSVRTHRFGGEDFVIRPLRPDDTERLRDFFYTHTMETVYHRYFTVKKELTADEALRLCSVDYRRRMAFGVLGSDGGGRETLIAVGRYDLDPRSNLAETALVVGEAYRQRGVATTLLQLLCDYARAQGIDGITATILPGNRSMVSIHRRLGHPVRLDPLNVRYHMRWRFDADPRPGSAPAGGPVATESASTPAPSP